MRLLAGVQLAALVVLGAVTVARFHVFAEIDERAHYAYVQEVAEHGRLPVLGRDLVSPQAQAIDEGTWPRRSARDPRTLGLAGQSYEAFQPPLYYLLAAPAFALVGDHRDKVFAVRALDLLLLLAAAALAVALARAVLGPDRGLAGACLALSVLLWPGVVVRGVTIGNDALALPLALALLLAAWHAVARPSPWRAVAAGALLGLCLLTKLTLLPLAPVAAVAVGALLRARGDRAALLGAAGALLAPAVLLAPWLGSNLHRYGTLTANGLAKRIQTPFLYPGGRLPGAGLLGPGLGRLADAALPQEWWPELSRPGLGLVLRVLPVAIAAGAAAAVVLRPRAGWRRALVLGLPLPGGVALPVVTLLAAHWDSFFARYLTPAFVAGAVLAAAGRAPARRIGAAAAVASAVVAVAWVVMCGAYFFTNAGAGLGIHARAPSAARGQ